jgi:cation diffusion facilitator CzcD-associated flavoprotein CzcO
MADTSSPDADAAPVETCDVCVVGAGIAGLNALFVAGRHLTRHQRAILVDRRARVGGMWIDTYPYVRLHRPHGFFTAGNIEWTLGRERSHLAETGEVLEHFEHCLEVTRGRLRVDEFFGWEMESDTEADGIVRVEFTSPSARVSSVSPDFCRHRGRRTCAPVPPRCGSSAGARPRWTPRTPSSPSIPAAR